MSTGSKQCRTCRAIKSLDEFYKRSASRDGHHSECKPCHKVRGHANYMANRTKRNAQTRAWRLANPDAARAMNRAWWLKRKHGITPEQYDAILGGQGGGCAICGSYSERFHLDHDHRTGRIRGILCGEHNQGLGLFGDSPTILRQAVAYLERTCESS